MALLSLEKLVRVRSKHCLTVPVSVHGPTVPGPTVPIHPN